MRMEFDIQFENAEKNNPAKTTIFTEKQKYNIHN